MAMGWSPAWALSSARSPLEILSFCLSWHLLALSLSFSLSLSHTCINIFSKNDTFFKKDKFKRRKRRTVTKVERQTKLRVSVGNGEELQVALKGAEQKRYGSGAWEGMLFTDRGQARDSGLDFTAGGGDTEESGPADVTRAVHWADWPGGGWEGDGSQRQCLQASLLRRRCKEQACEVVRT